MSLEEAIKLYSDKFGGFPYFLVMGLPDSKVVELVQHSLNTNKEIKPIEGMVY